MLRSRQITPGSILVYGILLIGTVVLTVLTIEGRISGSTVTSIATLLLVIVTAGYVMVTQRLVTETRAMADEARRGRQQEIRPVLEFHAAEHGSFIKNVGTGPARDIEVTLTMEPEGTSHSIALQYLPAQDQVGVYVSPFADLQDREYLGVQLDAVPTEELPETPAEQETFWEDLDHPYQEVMMEWSCEDIWGNRHTETSEYDLWQLMEETGGYEDRKMDPEFSIWQISQELRAIRTLMEDRL